MISVNGERLLARINELGAIGKDAEEEEPDWLLLIQKNRAGTWFPNG